MVHLCCRSYLCRMTNFIPIFPLGIVVYPGENLNLHIFEPRYKQLVADAIEQKTPFGIPTVLEGEIAEYGTLVEISEVNKTYHGGEMDIRTVGLKVFRILELVRDLPEKMYSGAIVSYPENKLEPIPAHKIAMLKMVRELHEAYSLHKEFDKPDELLTAYDLAHHVGLSVQMEYELLMLLDERQRHEYLKRYLSKSIMEIDAVDRLKLKIAQNGHFKNLPGLDISHITDTLL